TALPRSLQAHRTANDLIEVGAVAVKQDKEHHILVEQKVLCASGHTLGKARPQLRDKRLGPRHDVRVVRKRRVWLVHLHIPDGLSFNKVRPEGLTFICDTLGQERIAITEMRYRTQKNTLIASEPGHAVLLSRDIECTALDNKCPIALRRAAAVSR